MKWLCGVRLAAVPLSGNNLRQPVHSHVPGSITRIGTGQRAVIPPAAGKLTVGPALHLNMRHILQWLIRHGLLPTLHHRRDATKQQCCRVGSGGVN